MFSCNVMVCDECVRQETKAAKESHRVNAADLQVGQKTGDPMPGEDAGATTLLARSCFITRV
jgi:hypothetical protein